MSGAGSVVYSRDKDDGESDIWDDTALIKAYDEAINSMKSQMASRLGIEPPDGSTPGTSSNPVKKKHKKNRKKHARKKPEGGSTATYTSKWRLGHHCRSVFTEDGQTYEAVILSLNDNDQSCVIRYLGYGNEEEQLLIDLLPSREYTTPSRPQSGAPSECGSMDWSQLSQAATSPRVLTPQPRGAGARGRGMGRGWNPGMSAAYSGGVGHHRPDLLPPPPLMPPMFPPMMGMSLPPFGSMSNFPQPGQMPSMDLPDMPMPPPFEDDIETDKAALHSMLLSWYMAGYHTGYYQGVQGKSTAPPDDPSLPGERESNQPPPATDR